MVGGVILDRAFQERDELLAAFFGPGKGAGQFDEGIDIEASESRALLEEFSDGLADLADASGETEVT